IRNSIEAYRPRRERKPFGQRLPGEESKRDWGAYLASARKLSSRVRELDGFKDGGPMWEYIMRPLNEAADAETRMRETATIALDRIFSTAYSGKEAGQLYVPKYIPELGASITKMERLMVALN